MYYIMTFLPTKNYTPLKQIYDHNQPKVGMFQLMAMLEVELSTIACNSLKLVYINLLAILELQSFLDAHCSEPKLGGTQLKLFPLSIICNKKILSLNKYWYPSTQVVAHQRELLSTLWKRVALKYQRNFIHWMHLMY